MPSDENAVEYHSALRDALCRVTECVMGLSSSLAEQNGHDEETRRGGLPEMENGGDGNDGSNESDLAGFGPMSNQWLQALHNHSKNMRYLVERYNEEGRREYQHTEAPCTTDLSEIFQEIVESRQKIIQKVKHIEKRLVHFPEIGAVPESAVHHGTVFSSIAARSHQKSELASLRIEHEKEVSSLRTSVEAIFGKLKEVQDEIIEMRQHYQDEMKSRIEIVESMHKQLIRSRDQMYSMNHKIGAIVKRLSSCVMDANMQIVLTLSELSKDSNLVSPPFMSFQEYATLKRGNESLQDRADELLRSIEEERAKRDAIAAELSQTEERRVVLQSKLKETNMRLQKVTVQLSLAPTVEEVNSLKATIRALQDAAARAQFSPRSTLSESEEAAVLEPSDANSPRIKVTEKRPVTGASGFEASAPSTSPERLGLKTPGNTRPGTTTLATGSLPGAVMGGAAPRDAQLGPRSFDGSVQSSPLTGQRNGSLQFEQVPGLDPSGLGDPDHPSPLQVSPPVTSDDSLRLGTALAKHLDAAAEEDSASRADANPASDAAPLSADADLNSASIGTAPIHDADAEQVGSNAAAKRTESSVAALEALMEGAGRDAAENTVCGVGGAGKWSGGSGLSGQVGVEAGLNPPVSAPGSEETGTLDYVYDRRLFKHVLRSVQASSRRFHQVLLSLAAVVRTKLAAQDARPEQTSTTMGGRVVRVGQRADDGPGPGRGRRLSVCDLLTSDLRHFAPTKVAGGTGAGDAVRRASVRMLEGPREALTGKRFTRYDAASRIQLTWLRRSRGRQMEQMARVLDQAYTVDTILLLLEKDEEWNDRQLSFAMRQLEALKALASDDQVRTEARQLKESVERESARCRGLEAKLVAMAANRTELEAQIHQLETAAVSRSHESDRTISEPCGSEKDVRISKQGFESQQQGTSLVFQIRADAAGLQETRADVIQQVAAQPAHIIMRTAEDNVPPPSCTNNAIEDALQTIVEVSGWHPLAGGQINEAVQPEVKARLDSDSVKSTSLQVQSRAQATKRNEARLTKATQTESVTQTDSEMVRSPATDSAVMPLDTQPSTTGRAIIEFANVKSEVAGPDKPKAGRVGARRRSRIDEAVGSELARLREAGRMMAETHAKFEAFVRFYVPVLHVQVEDAVATLAEVVKHARMAATEEGEGAWSGIGEAEVTDRLLALVDETVETLDEEGRLRAQRRVDQDFESVRVSSLALQGLFSPRSPQAPKPANAIRGGRKARNLTMTNVPPLRLGLTCASGGGQISGREIGRCVEPSARLGDTLPRISPSTSPSVLRPAQEQGSARPSPLSTLPNIATPALHAGSPALSDFLVM